MTRINPYPQVVIDGDWLQCLGSQIHTNVTAMAGLHVTWGRDNLFSHPTPAKATVRIYDPSGEGGTYAQKFLNRTLLGKQFNLFYDDDELNRFFIFYRGIVTAASAEQYPIAGDNGRHGWMITLTGTSIESEMGNIKPKKNDVFPPETALNRAIRLNNYQQFTTGIQDIFFEPTKTGQTMWGPDNPGGSNILAHMQQFYQSMGVSYSYWPDENVMRYTARYAVSGGAHLQLATLPDDGGPRYVVIRPTQNFSWYGGDIVSYSSFIPGLYCKGGPLTIDRADGINQVSLDWKDQHQTPAWGDWTTKKPASMPNGVPIRLYSATSWLDDGIYLDPTLDFLYDVAINEASIPPHPEITWNTKTDGGFYKWSDLRHFSHCGEWGHFSYLGGSRFDRFLGGKGIYGRIGGSVFHDGKNWTIGARLQPVRPANWAASANITYTDLANLGIKWGPPPANWTPSERYLHPSITWPDLQKVTDKTTLYTY